MNLISVVVPIFNAEKYIQRCVDSILQQSFQSLELILVDDGSSDNSGRICDSLAEMDYRIKVIHQANAGVTAARRKGVCSSTSSWITFVDADDSLPINALETLWRAASSGVYDIICGRLDDLKAYSKDSLSFSQYQHAVIKGDKVHLGPVARLISKHLFTDNILDLPREIRKGEDMLMNIRLAFANTRPVCLLNERVYNYLYNAESCISTFKSSIDYEMRFHAYLKESIPHHLYEQFRRDVVITALNGVQQLALQSTKNTWAGTEYFRSLLQEAEQINVKISKYQLFRLTASNRVCLNMCKLIDKLLKRLCA